MYRLKWFIAGVSVTLVAQATALAGFVLGQPEPPAVAVAAVALERQMTFKILAPKGYEDVGYVQLDCKPNIKATVLTSKLNGRR